MIRMSDSMLLAFYKHRERLPSENWILEFHEVREREPEEYATDTVLSRHGVLNGNTFTLNAWNITRG